MTHRMKTLEVFRASTNSDELLKTIKLPIGAHNFHKITERLPKPNYEDANLKRYSSESVPRLVNVRSSLEKRPSKEIKGSQNAAGAAALPPIASKAKLNPALLPPINRDQLKQNGGAIIEGVSRNISKHYTRKSVEFHGRYYDYVP